MPSPVLLSHTCLHSPLALVSAAEVRTAGVIGTNRRLPCICSSVPQHIGRGAVLWGQHALHSKGCSLRPRSCARRGELRCTAATAALATIAHVSRREVAQPLSPLLGPPAWSLTLDHRLLIATAITAHAAAPTPKYHQLMCWAACMLLPLLSTVCWFPGPPSLPSTSTPPVYAATNLLHPPGPYHVTLISQHHLSTPQLLSSILSPFPLLEPHCL
jgi:hypothetical protein